MNEITGIVYAPAVFSILLFCAAVFLFFVYRNKQTKILIVISIIPLFLLWGIFLYLYILDLRFSQKEIRDARQIKSHIENYCATNNQFPETYYRYSENGYYECFEETNKCKITYYLAPGTEKFIKIIDGSVNTYYDDFKEYTLEINCKK